MLVKIAHDLYIDDYNPYAVNLIIAYASANWHNP
jgi:hypothetical protein